MTVGQALTDPTTALGRAAERLRRERMDRLAKAQEIVRREGITLEQAIARIWNI